MHRGAAAAYEIRLPEPWIVAETAVAPVPLLAQTPSRAVVGCAVAYCAVHAAVRFLLSPTLSVDDAEQALWAQRFALDYSAQQPPLYTWLLRAVTAVSGPGLVAATVLRYALMLVTLLLLGRCARIVGATRERAILIASSPLLLYLLAFNAHYDLTHTMLMLCAVALTLALFLEAMERPNVLVHVALGGAATVGLLAKDNYALFAGALLVAAASLPEWRRCLTWRAALAAGAVPLAVLGPAWAWGSAARIASQGEFAAADAGVAAAARAALRFAAALVDAVVPLAPLAVALFPEALRPAAVPPAPRNYRALFGRTVAVALAAALVAVCLLGASNVKSRWLLPAVICLPFWFFSGDLRCDRLAVRGRRWAAAVAIVSLVALVGRFGIDWMQPRRSAVASRTLPVAEIARDLAPLAASGAAIVAESKHLGGNLAALLPGAVVASLDDAWSLRSLPAGCDLVFVWRDAPLDERPKVVAAIEALSGRAAPPAAADATLRVPFPTYPARLAEFHHVAVRRGAAPERLAAPPGGPVRR